MCSTYMVSLNHSDSSKSRKKQQHYMANKYDGRKPLRFRINGLRQKPRATSVYLAVVLDWFSRRVLSWGVSITMEAAFCVETLEDAVARHGKPDIFNTDQGSQFTGSAFTRVLATNGIAISMDGKGAWRDNVFVERLWRSVKYEEVYLRAYESVFEARTSIGRYLDFYNGRRTNSSLDDMTPDQAYFNLPPLRVAA